MDKFLEKIYSSKPKWIRRRMPEQTNNSWWNRRSNQNLTAQKTLQLNGFTGQFNQTFKEEVTHILLRLFQKIQEHRRCPNFFYEASITQIPKPEKGIKKEKFRTISQVNIDTKILNKFWQTASSSTLKRSQNMIKWDPYQGCKDGTIFENQSS